MDRPIISNGQEAMTQASASTATRAATPQVVEAPFISVVVPVRNEEASLGALLEELLGQDYPPDRYEVLVAEGGSTDRTRDVVAAFSLGERRVRLLDNPRQWSSAGRNVAVAASRGDLIVVIDGHCELGNPRYLADLADVFTSSGADCVGRPQPLEAPAATRLQRAISAARASRLGHHPDSHVYSQAEGFVPPQSVAVAYRREVFDRAGLFDETFDACEDVEFNHRIARTGLRCYFTPRVQVRYHPRATLAGLFRQMIRYGRGRVRLLRKHPDTFTTKGFAPALLLAAFAAGPVALLCGGLAGALWLGGAAVYLTTVLLFSIVTSLRHRELGLLPWLPLVFLTIHSGAAVGQWLELVRPARRAGRVNALDKVLERQGVNTPRSPLLEPTLNALTIDVEDYYHVTNFEHCLSRDAWEDCEPRVEQNTRGLLDILAAHDVRATFFVLGWVAQRHPWLVRAIRDAGHEIGCHSHAHRLVYEQTPQEFRDDLRRGRGILQDITGDEVSAYRAPSFSITPRSLWALDILAEEGVRIDSSIYPVRHHRYGLPDAPAEPHRIDLSAGSLWEFPPPVWHVWRRPIAVGGGGYFRLYPYALTRHALRAINKAGRPFAAYLHPWEIDPDQPRMPAGRMATFRHYVGLRRTEQRLHRLLEDFRFSTLSAALASWRGVESSQRAAA
jgi:polysaccharide deacetylase family protein (PEP-CTERM system associated)